MPSSRTPTPSKKETKPVNHSQNNAKKRKGPVDTTDETSAKLGKSATSTKRRKTTAKKRRPTIKESMYELFDLQFLEIKFTDKAEGTLFRKKSDKKIKRHKLSAKTLQREEYILVIFPTGTYSKIEILGIDRSTLTSDSKTAYQRLFSHRANFTNKMLQDFGDSSKNYLKIYTNTTNPNSKPLFTLSSFRTRSKKIHLAKATKSRLYSENQVGIYMLDDPYNTTGDYFSCTVGIFGITNTNATTHTKAKKINTKIESLESRKNTLALGEQSSKVKFEEKNGALRVTYPREVSLHTQIFPALFRTKYIYLVQVGTPQDIYFPEFQAIQLKTSTDNARSIFRAAQRRIHNLEPYAKAILNKHGVFILFPKYRLEQVKKNLLITNPTENSACNINEILSKKPQHQRKTLCASLNKIKQQYEHARKSLPDAAAPSKTDCEPKPTLQNNDHLPERCAYSEDSSWLDSLFDKSLPPPLTSLKQEEISWEQSEHDLKTPKQPQVIMLQQQGKHQNLGDRYCAIEVVSAQTTHTPIDIYRQIVAALIQNSSKLPNTTVNLVLERVVILECPQKQRKKIRDTLNIQKTAQEHVQAKHSRFKKLLQNPKLSHSTTQHLNSSLTVQNSSSQQTLPTQPTTSPMQEETLSMQAIPPDSHANHSAPENLTPRGNAPTFVRVPTPYTVAPLGGAPIPISPQQQASGLAAQIGTGFGMPYSMPYSAPAHLPTGGNLPTLVRVPTPYTAASPGGAPIPTSPQQQASGLAAQIGTGFGMPYSMPYSAPAHLPTGGNLPAFVRVPTPYTAAPLGGAPIPISPQQQASGLAAQIGTGFGMPYSMPYSAPAHLPTGGNLPTLVRVPSPAPHSGTNILGHRGNMPTMSPQHGFSNPSTGRNSLFLHENDTPITFSPQIYPAYSAANSRNNSLPPPSDIEQQARRLELQAQACRQQARDLREAQALRERAQRLEQRPRCHPTFHASPLMFFHSPPKTHPAQCFTARPNTALGRGY